MSSPAPYSLPIARALEQSEPLARLSERLAQSRRRYEAIAPLLPDELRRTVRPGPIDERHWTLLAASSATAAKLRQMVPALQERLEAEGWAEVVLRVRVAGNA